MDRVFSVTLALAALVTLPVACGGVGQSTTVTTEPIPIYAVSEVGGCAMMGPNCTSRVLWSDGTVTVYRQPTLELPLAGLAALTPEATAEVDPSVPRAVVAAVAAADLHAVVAGLPPGTCWACVDGVDYILLLATAEGEVRIDSAESALDSSIPLIAELNNAAVAMAHGTDLPIQSR